MAESKKKPTGKESDGTQTVKPKKLLRNGLDPSIGKQWVKGQSGNPAGPKPGYKHINTWIQELVSDPEFEATIVDLKQGYIPYKGAPMTAIIKAIIAESLGATDPNVRKAAREQLLKYGWPTKNEVTGADGEALTLPVVRIIDERQHGNPTA